MEIVASGGPNAKPYPPTKENLDQVVAGKLRIRQKPGPKNALGLAKFIFPNADNIYMHGTPAQELFSQPGRDSATGASAWRTRRPRRVDASGPAGVDAGEDRSRDVGRDPNPRQPHRAADGGALLRHRPRELGAVVFFVDDIYHHDEKLDAALDGGYPYPRSES